MKSLILILISLALSACGTDGRFKSDLFSMTGGVAVAAPAPVVEREPPTRAELCRFARESMSLPVLFNAKARSDAYEKLGKEQANNLFYPVAKTNNSFRCLCGTPEEKLKAKCGS